MSDLDPVARALVGFVPAAASPTADPTRLGSATLDVQGDGHAAGLAQLTIQYVVGHHGVDDRGALKLVWRFPADGGSLQFEDPEALNYVTAEASADVRFRMEYQAFGHARPWFKCLTLRVVSGCLAEGDTITLRLGDQRQGSPGLRLQTFCERAWELRLLVDPCATGHFVEVPGRLAMEIGPGPATVLRAVAPTRWPVGQPFWLGLRAEDAWGNPARWGRELKLSGVHGLPEGVTLDGPLRLEGLVADQPGVVRIEVRDTDGRLLCRSNPVVVSADGSRSYWADLHGQSGETVGVNSAEQYFAFARDTAFLDACSHQANDFQINNAFWDHLNSLTERLNQPGRFVALPGYEWSGNTAVGGDRNVYFRTERRPIRRSSHALLLDTSDIDSDCTTATALFQALADEDAVAFAHVGGRWADLTRGHDEQVERSVEIHSAWGSFEWLLHDAFDLGLRVGVVANSDGHKGRPGASHPGAATFGAFGGLTCYRMDRLDRDALFDCLRARRHYATSGARLDLDVDVAGAAMGQVLAFDGERAQVRVRVAADAPIERVEVRVGTQTVVTHRPYELAGVPAGDRVRLTWRGSAYRGRGRQITWDGQVLVRGARLLRAERFAAWNRRRRFEVGLDRVAWEAITTGNRGGVDLWLQGDGSLEIETGPVTATVALADLPQVIEAGGLDVGLELTRLPDNNPHLDTELACTVPLGSGDNPVWVCVTLESGHQAWSSPVYLVREPA